MDCNCRCCVTHIPRWAVDVPLSKIDNEKTFKNGRVNIVKGEDYNKYKQKYFNNIKKDDTITALNLLDKLNVDIDSYDFSKPNNIQEKASELLNLNELPQIVDKESYDKANSNEIIRYLRDFENVTAEDAYNNTLYGNIQYSDIRNSQYGRGIYFGDKQDDSLEFTYGDSKSKSITSKISEDANILEFKSMLTYIKDVSQRTKELPENIRKVYEKERSLLYMLDGYDGIKIAGKNYYCIYNRKVLLIKDE